MFYISNKKGDILAFNKNLIIGVELKREWDENHNALLRLFTKGLPDNIHTMLLGIHEIDTMMERSINPLLSYLSGIDSGVSESVSNEDTTSRKSKSGEQLGNMDMMSFTIGERIVTKEPSSDSTRIYTRQETIDYIYINEGHKKIIITHSERSNDLQERLVISCLDGHIKILSSTLNNIALIRNGDIYTVILTCSDGEAYRCKASIDMVIELVNKILNIFYNNEIKENNK